MKEYEEDEEEEEIQETKEDTEENKFANFSLAEKSSFVYVKDSDVDAINTNRKLKERLCCIELINNNRIYLRYELRWTIQDLIKNIVNHPEFKKLYPARDWIFNSENHLPLFDVHLALFKKIKSDNETKINFRVTFNELHQKGLLKNPKYPFFIFKDNRNNGDLIQFHEDKVEFLKKLKEKKYETYLMYNEYLPRVNPLNILNCHPEFETFFQFSKNSISELSEYNINPLIYEGKEIDDKQKKKIAKTTTINEINEKRMEAKKELDWFVYDDESMNFLTTLDKEEFKRDSNIKFLKNNNKVIFEDIYKYDSPESTESNQLTEKDMENLFVDVSYKEITKKLKVTFKTTGYDLLEMMNKKLGLADQNLQFDCSTKILKVKSLNDYVVHMKTPLSQFAYINECIMRNTVPNYVIMDNPSLAEEEQDYFDSSNQNETITIKMKDGSSSKSRLDRFIGLTSKISKGKYDFSSVKQSNPNKSKKDNSGDELVSFIDSIEDALKKHDSEEISATQKEIEKKEQDYFNNISSIQQNTFIQPEDAIFEDDEILMHLQSKLGERTSNFNINQSILALNSGGSNGNISQIGDNPRQSYLINPNYLRQSTLKQGIVHSIYDQNTILNIINESMNIENDNKQKKRHVQGPSSMMTKARKKNSETPNVFENSIQENIQIYPLLLENSLPLNIREIKIPFSILVNCVELNTIFDSYPRESDNCTEILIFKFQINIGAEEFCRPVSIKWNNKRNKKNNLPSNALFNKRIYFDIDYSNLPTFSTLIIKIKHLVFGEGSKQVTSNTVQWVNFKLFDHNRNLMTGKHKLNLHSKEFNDFSYFTFIDNITEDNPSKIYFEIESFSSSVHNSNYKDDNNSELNVDNLIITQQEKEEIEKIKNKTPFDTLNIYDKNRLWSNRYKLSKVPELLPKLLLCVDYKNPQHVKELKKILKMANPLSPVQSMELLTGKYLHEYIRNFAVKCLYKSSINEIETYLIQLVQGLKFEMYHYNKLAIFLLRKSISYPLTIGHCFFWSLRSEMSNPNIQQRFGLYLQVFLSKIGPKLIKIYEQECDFVRRMNLIAEIPKNKKISNKTLLKKKFTDALSSYNEEIMSNNLEISMPLNFKIRIKGINVEKCRYMKSKKKPLWLVLKNADDLGDDIIVLFKAGDDLRMDIVTLQLFKIMQTLWYQNNLHLKMSLYNVISTGDMEGMLEVVTNSLTVAQIHKEQGGSFQSFKKDALKSWILKTKLCDESECYKNFMLSNVAYCCATFVLGVGDRHSDNIMLKKNGELFHIDFGHFLGHFKYKMGIKRERAPFVFTNQFKTVLDSEGAPGFDEFKKIFWEAYKILRDHSDVLVTLLRMLICTDIPELKEKDIEYLNQSLVLNYNTKDAEKFLDEKLKESIESWSVPLNFFIHYVANK